MWEGRKGNGEKMSRRKKKQEKKKINQLPNIMYLTHSLIPGSFMYIRPDTTPENQKLKIKFSPSTHSGLKGASETG